MAFLIFGSASLFFPYGGTPRSIDLVLSPTMLLVWSIMLLVGSMLTLIGIAWRGRFITALGIERVGLILHSAACFVYTIALVVHWDQHNGAIVVTSFIAAIAVANLWRIVQVTQSMRRIVALTTQLEEEGE
ncbi:MAG TPA: hypothetical protein VIV60_06075 [Polyangiaceae bacterium]